MAEGKKEEENAGRKMQKQEEKEEEMVKEKQEAMRQDLPVFLNGRLCQAQVIGVRLPRRKLTQTGVHRC